MAAPTSLAALSASSASKNFFQQNLPTIATRVTEYDDSYLLLPYVMNSIHAEYMNDLILSSAESALKELDRPVYAEYTIENNNDGILSLALRFYDMETGFACGVYPVTFSLKTGTEYQLADFFQDADGRWRRVLPDIITQQAKQQGMTLLSALLPITDKQGFFIRDTDIVLIYRPYEIATFEAGIPEFSIPISSLTDLLADNSALWQLTDFADFSADDTSETAAG